MIELGLSLTGGRAAGAVTSPSPPSGLAPDEVTGLVRWFKAESITGAQDDPQTQWNDTTANGHAISDSGMSAPTVNTGTPYNFLRFDGVDDEMDFGEITTVRTVFMVLRFWNAATDSAAILGHPTLKPWHGGHSATSDQDRVINGQDIHASTYVINGAARLNGATVSPTSIVKPATFKVVAFRTTANVEAQSLSNDRGTGFAPYDLREVAIYNAAVDDNEMDHVCTWLMNKFSLS